MDHRLLENIVTDSESNLNPKPSLADLIVAAIVFMATAIWVCVARKDGLSERKLDR